MPPTNENILSETTSRRATQAEEYLNSFAGITAKLRSEDAGLLNQVAARTLNNLLYLLAKSGSTTGEIDAELMELFWDRLERDIQLIQRLGAGTVSYAPRNARAQVVGEEVLRKMANDARQS